MGLPAENRDAPRLRLVVDNPAPQTFLMPILDVERRLVEVERTLRRGRLAAADRTTLLQVRDLLRCELAARPFRPDLARRCEHRLRWIEGSRPRQDGTARGGLWARAIRALSAILPPPVASA